jgi:magnesium transporter
MAEAADVAPLLAHPDESAGGRMTRGYIALRADMTVDEAINYLRLVKPNTEEAYYLYVVDAADRLEGVVSLRHLVVAPPRTPVSEVMSRDVVAVRAGTDQEECARLIRRYNLLALPVVDEGDHLVGVTTIDDLLDVATEEATEDMYRMVGMAETESFYRPVPSSIRRRLPWLFVNLLTALAAASVVSFFEGTISRFAALAVFMPVVAGMGGNAGIQTLTLTVRGLALGEVSAADAVWVILRELAVASANGLAIGVAVGLTAYVWEGNVYLSLVLGAAMMLNMLAAALAGVLVPLGLKVAGADPALASGVFVTTVTDILGFLFFLGLATAFISYMA